jgi:heterodisulfide reductase subunit A-like polyferredoxin
VNLDGSREIGRRVLVIGGGNSALDAARTALRCGADEVTLVYRRTRAEMPADAAEIEAAQREGVKLTFLAAPKAFVGGPDGRVARVQCVRMKLGAPDSSGRPAPEPIRGSEFTLPCDAVIVTIGQMPDVASLGERLGLEETTWGTLRADPVTLETGVPGVFAGGDCVTGPDVVVTAMLAGKKAAESIDRWLNGRDLRAGRELEGPYHTEYVIDTAGVQTQRQIPIPSLDPAWRARSFDEVHTGYTQEQAVLEAKRCLACGICSDCRMCVAACQAGAIRFDMREERRELKVGAILLAPGYQLFDARRKPDLGYGRFPNVVTSIEFERMLSASGPYGGHVLRPGDRREPKRIAFIQCVGSRDAEHDYCSSVCCMYATKEAILAKEHLGRDLACDVFFMDVRAHGKGFEQYVERAQALGVNYIRCRPPAVREVPETGNLVVEFLGDNDRKVAREYDLVVLSVGLLPPAGAGELGRTFGVDLDDLGFCRSSTFTPVETSRPGVFVAGPFSEPKDIPETVMQASAAASRILSLLEPSRGSLITPKEYPAERDVAGLPVRVGVFVCHCGSNIASVVNVADVVSYAGTLPDVVHAEAAVYACSNDAQDLIKERIREHRLNRVVVASCTPRTHEPLFRNTLREAGLNQYLFEMANIRDQCSWVHAHEPAAATAKAKDLVRMAVAKARLLEPLHRRSVPVERAALVIGGGLAGMTAALELGDQNVRVYLVEREGELGGNLRRLHDLLDGVRPREALQTLIERVRSHDRIEVFTDARIERLEGSVGAFRTTISMNGTSREVGHGVVVVATGAVPYTPTEYLYGQDPRILTQLELEQRLATPGAWAAAANGKAPRTVVMIQCVGSRDAAHPYCSRVCCSEAIKNALRLTREAPGTRVYVLYRDIRTYGFRERYYTEARRRGVMFVRYDADRKPEVSANGTSLRVRVFDATLRLPIEIAADLVVLSVGIVPPPGSDRVAQLLKVPRTGEGFFLEAHLKLRPVDFATDGVFLCGLAHSAKAVDETIVQAQAAAARAATVLARDRIELEANISEVVPENCDGCAYCVAPCPFHAITLVEYVRNGSVKKIIEVDETACKGCGCCQATCPKHGVFVRGFALAQIASQAEAAFGAS